MEDNGASLRDRATAASQSSPQAVSSIAGIPSAWTVRETAHLNGGREWFGYEYQCLQEPRLRRLDRYERKTRSVKSEWRVDGEACADEQEAMQRLAVAPVIGEDEMAVLQLLSPDFMSKSELDAIDIDWRNRQHSLSQKGLIWWEAGKVRLTAQAIEARRAETRSGSVADESAVGTADAPNPCGENQRG